VEDMLEIQDVSLSLCFFPLFHISLYFLSIRWMCSLYMEVCSFSSFLLSILLPCIPGSSSGSWLYSQGNNKGTPSTFRDGDEMMVEVNVDSSPRTLHFFKNGIQETLFVRNIPQSVKFAVSLFLFLSFICFFFHCFFLFFYLPLFFFFFFLCYFIR
jgi:hypothetical protein